MRPEMETPARLADATGAKIETAGFVNAEYRVRACLATPIDAAALRVRHLARHGLAAERAAMLAPFIFEEGSHAD